MTDSASMASEALALGVPQADVDDMMTDLGLLFSTVSNTKSGIPIGSQVVKQMSAGRIWRTPDGRYIIEENVFSTAPPPPTPPAPPNPTPREDYEPPGWPPENPPDTPPSEEPSPNEPQCKKTVFLPNNGKMARMERIQSFDSAILTGKSPTFLEPCTNGPGDAGIIAGNHPMVFTDAEVLVPGDGKAGNSRNYVSLFVDIGPGKTQLLPLNGLNTSIIDRPLKVVNLNLGTNPPIMPPTGVKFLRGSNGCIYMTSDQEIQDDIEVEIRDMGRIKAPTAHKNFRYRGIYDDPTFLSNVSKKFISHPSRPGMTCVKQEEEIFKCAEKTPRQVKRTLIGKVPDMDQACSNMADRIIEEVLYAKAIDYRTKDQKGIGLKGSQRALLELFDPIFDSGQSISSYQDLYDAMQNTLTVGLVVSRIANWCQAGFDCKRAAEDDFDQAYLQAGACAQRSAVAFLVLNRLGIPTRYIGNSCHAYVEVYAPAIETWYDIDLKGCNPPGPTGPSEDGEDQDPETPQSEEQDIPEDKDPPPSEDSEDEDSEDDGEDEGEDDGEESEEGEGEEGEGDEGEGDEGEGEGEEDSPDTSPGDVEAFSMDAWESAIQNMINQGYSEADARQAIEIAKLWGGFE
jgi:hypothetical protein